MKPSQIIVKQSDAIKAAAKRHGFSNLRVFGPISRGQDHQHSILYILGEALAQSTPVSQTKLERELSTVLNIHVIILTESTLPAHMAAEVTKGTIPI